MKRRRKVPPRDVCDLFELKALQCWYAGITHYSADALLHIIRFHYTVERGDRHFKCCNDWTPLLARWFMSRHPECGKKFFTLRPADWSQLAYMPWDMPVPVWPSSPSTLKLAPPSISSEADHTGTSNIH